MPESNLLKRKALAWINDLIACGHWEDFQRAEGAIDVLIHLDILSEDYEAQFNGRVDPNGEDWLKPLE